MKRISKIKLNKQHIEQLAKSGISRKLSIVQHLQSVPAEYIRRRFGWGSQIKEGGMLFPYFTANGPDPRYARVRLDHPITRKFGNQLGMYSKDQGQIRYLSLPKATNRLYIPKDVWKILNDSRVPLYFVEGEKKALCLVERGFMAVGIPGIYGSYSKGKLLKDFDLIELKDREIYLCFDGDKFTNKHVRQAEQKLAKDLWERIKK